VISAHLQAFVDKGLPTSLYVLPFAAEICDARLDIKKIAAVAVDLPCRAARRSRRANFV